MFQREARHKVAQMHAPLDYRHALDLLMQLTQHCFNVSDADCSLDDSDVSSSWMKKKMSRRNENGVVWVVRALQQGHLTYRHAQSINQPTNQSINQSITEW